MNRARAAILAVAGLTLAACGNVHPGAAAVVDGETISMETLNETAGAYCALTLNAQKQQGVDPSAVSNLDIRRQAVTGLVSVVVARKLAASEGITIEPSAYEITDAERDRIAEVFPKDDVDAIVQAYEDNQELSAISIALAEKVTGQKQTDANAAQLAEAGQAAITDAFARNHVKFAPRFGLSGSGKPTTDTGSLSATPTDLEAPAAEELPDTQRCS